ncbi:MAG: hypothetical protein DRJ49_02885 [Thermoprotei archaeon]|nr:MAG: hypothetical protein DRJ49_02885 [Thermoprotei archaeon]
MLLAETLKTQGCREYGAIMEDDIELLKMKRLLKLQRELLKRKIKTTEAKERPRDLVLKYMDTKAKEVLEMAEMQYPKVAEYVVRELYRLIKLGKIKSKIDGYSLFELFARLGYPVRMPTRIVIKEKGRSKPLSEVLKERLRKD